MVSDSEIAGCVHQILLTHAAADADPPLFSALLQEAESQLRVDLAHRADFIREQMELLLPPKTLSPAPTTLPALHPVPMPLPPPAMAPPVAAPAPLPGIAFYPPPPLAAHYPHGVPLAGGMSYQQQLHQPPPIAAAAALVPVGTPQSGDSQECASSAKRKRGGPGGLNKVCGVSPELQTIVGETAMSRTQIVKQLWAYIRENNLQDPEDKRKIICNEQLRMLFGIDTTDMFKMNKLLAKHIIPLDPKDQMREAKKQKASAIKSEPSQGSMVMSDALARFIGMQKGKILKDDVIKRLRDYITSNHLEDAMTSSIICDQKLLELFDCQSFPSSRLLEMLAPHFIRKP